MEFRVKAGLTIAAVIAVLGLIAVILGFTVFNSQALAIFGFVALAIGGSVLLIILAVVVALTLAVLIVIGIFWEGFSRH